MDAAALPDLLDSLLLLPQEVEWVEFKHNNDAPDEIGEYISALSNAASLLGKEMAYIVWGVEDGTHRALGTSFQPRRQKVGGQELQNWLSIHLSPRLDFRFYEFDYHGRAIVLMEVPPCLHTPVRWKDTEFIRSGSYKKKLKDFPEKERALWLQLSRTPFEKGIAHRDATSKELLSLLDYAAYFELSGQSVPLNETLVIERLLAEKIIEARGRRFHITNLGAILFARRLSHFESLARKAVRVIIYNGTNRVRTIKEFVSDRGYAAGFESLVAYVNDQLPRSEVLGQALRHEQRAYPEVAVRELVANAIIHQDFAAVGDSPLVEIFNDRLEITNSGHPLISPLRFIDEPPQSRNEALASFMRRLSICEERGSGVDKVIAAIEMFQLPAPEFLLTQNHTKAILFAPRKLTGMDSKDKIRACYQHACLQYVSNLPMTNATLRERLGIAEKNYSMASRIISDTIREGLVKPFAPDNTSRKHARYVPFWA
jgi:ATP-dependent DNA helicase RecG